MFWKKENKNYQVVLLLLLSGVMITALAGKMWWNSVALYPLAAFSLLQQQPKVFAARILKNKFVICSILFFLLHVAQLTMDVLLSKQGFEIEKKTGFLVIPVLLLPLLPLTNFLKAGLLKITSLFLLLLFFYFLVSAGMRYMETGNSNEFFYHQLVSPLHHHAVYLSAFVSILILWLATSPTRFTFSPLILILVTSLLLLFLFLLASKSIIFITLLLVIYEGFRKSLSAVRKWKYYVLLSFVILAAGILLISNNPVSNRFREVYKTDLSLLSKKQYAPDIYFNAVQFRLIAWKFSLQAVAERKAYLLGVGAGNAQDILNDRYRTTNMYVGEAGNKQGGYINFNAHNQFVQTYLQTGIAGLALLFLMLLFYFRSAYLQKNRTLMYTLLILTVFFLSESVLEGHYGLVLFLFIPQLLNEATRENSVAS